MEKHPDGSVSFSKEEFSRLAGHLLDQQKALEDSLRFLNGRLVELGMRDRVEKPVMTEEGQDMLAAAIKAAFNDDGGMKNIDDQGATGSRLRAISRLTQSIADRLGGRFDRARFVQKAGFGIWKDF